MIDAFDVGNQNAAPPLPPLLYRRVVVPNAQVKTLFSSPLTIVPAQGATKAIFPEYIHIHKPAGIAFAGGMTNVLVQWTGAPSNLFTITVANFLDTAAKRTVIGPSESQAAYNFDTGLALNNDLKLQVSGADPTTGDTDLFVAITYRIWELAPPTWL